MPKMTLHSETGTCRRDGSDRGAGGQGDRWRHRGQRGGWRCWRPWNGGGGGARTAGCCCLRPKKLPWWFPDPLHIYRILIPVEGLLHHVQTTCQVSSEVTVSGATHLQASKRLHQERPYESVKELTEAAATATDAAALVAPEQSPLSRAPCNTLIQGPDSHLGQLPAHTHSSLFTHSSYLSQVRHLDPEHLTRLTDE